jgi:outer membrane lipoprotein-sorting protein
MRICLQSLVLGTAAILGLLTVAHAQIAGESPELERVIAKMDATAKTFVSAETNVVWDRYDKVINETDSEEGKVYFRREGGEIQMAADFIKPNPKYVIYSGGKVQVYLPKANEVDQYDATKHRSDVESFLVLGFGGSGKDLFKSYDVKYLGAETVAGTTTERLELIPKSVQLRNNIGRILLWIDPKLGVSVQQQFFESSGNYRLAKYSDIHLNQKLPDSAFRLKTNGKTKFVSPQS